MIVKQFSLPRIGQNIIFSKKAQAVTLHVETLIMGAGAAGLFCAGRLAEAGQRVLVVDHARKPAEKVRISGGGRCNFTNIHTKADNFLSENPHFSKSALSRYSPEDFCALMRTHDLSWTEKTLGQLFCDQKSGAVIEMLLKGLTTPGGELWLETNVKTVSQIETGFMVETSREPIEARRLVIATGGLSIPKMGATGFAYDIARQFGHTVVTPRPALVPFTFSGELKNRFSAISGVSTPAKISAGPAQFEEALLFTHRGLSGPSVLQASSYWREGEAISIDLVPQGGLLSALKETRRATPKRTLSSAMSEHFPKRFVEQFGQSFGIGENMRMADLSNAVLEKLCLGLSAWSLKPSGTEGWRTAEVTAGGISTDGLSSKTLESRKQDGLYFIGECVDVTGWLGGYNFQWAWASAAAAAGHIIEVG